MAEKLDNIPRAVLDPSRSRRARYQQLVVGREGWGPLLAYEAITTLAARRSGALGLMLRSRLYPHLLGACGRNVFFGVDITLRHPSKIRIGNNVVIDDGAVLDAKGDSNRGITIGDGVFIGRHSSIYTKDGDIVLEDGVNIGSLCSVFSASSVRIGRNTLLAGYTYVIGGGHDFSRTDVAVIDQERPSRGITIGAGGWMGAGVSILDGVTIGHDVIVGANSVVTRDLPDFAIAAGTPARVMRERSGPDTTPV
jgi:acetyltransferase-like isoleucine patch superfamily enzyme